MPTDHLKEKETNAWIKETDPRLYINPLPVRIWHWLHAMGFVTLILTGIQIRYSDMINVLSFETAVRTTGRARSRQVCKMA